MEAGEKRGDQVREVFITPLKDPENGRFLGAFVFGLPLPAITDRVLNEQSKRSDYGEIMSGIYLEGKLVSTTVPENQRETVEKALAESLASSSKSNREILLPIGDSKHRLIYRVLNQEAPFPRPSRSIFTPWQRFSMRSWICEAVPSPFVSSLSWWR